MKTIIFVDDEPRILEGLQRMLRPQRKDWEMRFATSGAEALAMLAEQPADLVVTDMRMPVMDGAELLQHVRQLHPAAIRIVLSGYFDGEAALRAVPVAHQFLAKPCDALKLRAMIDRCSLSAEILADESARRIVGTMGQLPVFQSTRTMLLSALDNPASSLDEIGELVGRDVGLAAKVLQLVHSAFFGLPREIVDVNTAVGYLGFDTIRQLLLLAEVMRSFRPGTVNGFTLEEFERHSNLVARITSRLPLRPSLRSSAVVAALLHDVGILVQSARIPEELNACCDEAKSIGIPLYVAEKSRHGTTHAEIGAYLLTVWGFPPEIVHAVGHHHKPAPPDEPLAELDVTSAVHIADVLAGAHSASCHFSLIDEPDNGGWEFPVKAGLASELRGWREIAIAESAACEVL